MKIQNRLTLIFSLLFGAILFVFVVSIYQFYKGKCRKYYFDRLHLSANIKVSIIDEEAITPNVLHTLYDNAPASYEPQVSIYNESGTLIYRDKQSERHDLIYRKLIKQVEEQGNCCVWNQNKHIYGFSIKGRQTNYIVFATGLDAYGAEPLSALKRALIVAYLIAMLLIILSIRLLTKETFRSVARMTDKVKDITRTNQLNLRLDEGNRKDELAKLAITFNQLLSQLATAFDAQKQFVYHISHELRTPLSAIITELELSKNNTKSRREEYEAAIDLALRDSRRLGKLSNSLLDMAKANYSMQEIARHKIRLDELLLEVCRKIQASEPDYTINICFDTDEQDDDRLISTFGNEYLLSVALANLIENGCKFSPEKSCKAHISYEGRETVIRIIDRGIGITSDDLNSIFTPFFRGSNADYAEGNGIGLSLTHKIIEIHQGSITVASQPGHTEFTIRLQNCF